MFPCLPPVKILWLTEYDVVCSDGGCELSL